MNKSIEQWSKVDAKHCATHNSAAANMYLIQDAQQDIAELASHASTWIKCSDRLPEVGVEVLIRIPTCGGFNVEGGSYQGDGVWYGAWCSTRGEGKCYKVAQWAPMPKPPEEV